MSNQNEQNTSAPAELNRVLSLRSLVFYGIAFIIPLAFFTTYGIVTSTTHGMVSLTYVVATLCMVFTAYSYCRMSKAFPQAGSVYTYATETFNPYIGFIAGWTIVLGYMFLPMLNYLASAVFIKAALPAVPIWVWVVLFTIIVTGANIFGIKVADIFNNVVVVLQLIFLLALAIMTVRYISGEGLDLFSSTAFYNSIEFKEVGIQGIAAGAAIVCLAFLGFDGIATLGEEAINPKKNIPRAIMICCIGVGTLYVVFTYLLQAAWPTAWSELTDLDGGAFEVITRVAGNLMGYFFVAGYVIGCIAASINAVASASRVLYGMGRDGLLPKRCFGYIHPKFKTPLYNILIMGAFGLTALFFSLTIASCLINFGALLGFTFVNLSAMGHYYFKNKNRTVGDFFRHLIVPLIGAVYAMYMLINLSGTSIIYGLIWLAIGIAWLAYVTKGFNKTVTMNLDA